MGSSLARFFVFDPRLGPTEETEHEKILYYWPPSTPLNRQQSDIGLSEALINFTRCSPSPSDLPCSSIIQIAFIVHFRTFSKDRPCEAVHLEKTRQAFYECEPDIWMVLVCVHISFRVPFHVRRAVTKCFCCLLVRRLCWLA